MSKKRKKNRRLPKTAGMTLKQLKELNEMLEEIEQYEADNEPKTEEFL